MKRSTLSVLRTGWITAAVALCALLSALALAPPRALAVIGPNDQPLTISNVSLDPVSVPYINGKVTVTADVVDGFGTYTGVYSVSASVYNSDGFSTVVAMANADSPTFTGYVDMPTNLTDSPVSYTIDIVAQDTNGAIVSQPAGEVEVEPQPTFDQPPVLSDIAVTPTSLPAAGGAVAIESSASDDRSVSEVYATVTAPNGSQTVVVLDPVSSSRFHGTFAAPANATASPVRYAVQVSALDDIGQQALEDAPAITVAAKPPPASGPLALTPDAITFASVRIGRSSMRFVTLRNRGSQRSAAVSGVLSVSGASFALGGARPAGVRFTLAPGQARVYIVVFKPARTGRATGRLNVVRTDGGQPGLGAALVGTGVRR